MAAFGRFWLSMILTEIGEIGVHHNGETYVLRPSLYAMSKIGSPKEILRTYAFIMHESKDKNKMEAV